MMQRQETGKTPWKQDLTFLASDPHAVLLTSQESAAGTHMGLNPVNGMRVDSMHGRMQESECV